MNKYHNIKCIIDGITFHSRKEGERYKQLKLLERCGEIKDLVLQPKFVLLENGFVACVGENGNEPIAKFIKGFSYVADFQYSDKKYAWKTVVEDVKGVKTDAYKLKKKLFLAKYPVIFLET